MGMYTQLVLNVQLKKDAPEKVIDTLKFMLSAETFLDVEEIHAHDHPLFATPRWTHMLMSSSYYFSPAHSKSFLKYDDIARSYYLSVLCDLKNYNDEIPLFLEWIRPYVEDTGFVGYSQYESDDHPRLIYFRSTGVSRSCPGSCPSLCL